MDIASVQLLRLHLNSASFDIQMLQEMGYQWKVESDRRRPGSFERTVHIMKVGRNAQTNVEFE